VTSVRARGDRLLGLTTALGHAREPIAMPTVSREDVIKVGQDIKVGKDEEALWPAFWYSL